MHAFIASILTMLFPKHRDVQMAETIPETYLAEVLQCREKAPAVYTYLPYRDPRIRALIRANKFHASAYATRLLSDALNEALGDILDERALEPLWKTPLIIPMPVSKERKRMRGYNQVERIVHQTITNAVFACEYANDILERHHRPSQTHVAREKRASNIQGAFFVRPTRAHRLTGRAVILVDDVIESGRTMHEAMRALKEAGAHAVVGIALDT
jgi:ComF family protein